MQVRLTIRECAEHQISSLNGNYYQSSNGCISLIVNRGAYINYILCFFSRLCTYRNKMEAGICEMCNSPSDTPQTSNKVSSSGGGGDKPPLYSSRDASSRHIDMFKAALDASNCVVCMDAKQDTILVPCGHNPCCSSCTSTALKGKCCICSRPVETSVFFYPV